MFVRRIRNKSGVTYIQVVEKVNRQYKVLHSFGGSSDENEIQSIIARAKEWIVNQQGIVELDFTNESQKIEQVLDLITSHRIVGIDLVLGKIFDEIGFNQIGDSLFKDLVLYRLVFPRSKLKTTEYLSRYGGKYYSEDEVYRYMDKLYDVKKELVQEISYAHTQSILPTEIKVVFYDVTTVYFQSEKEDDFRKVGYSKDGKYQNPQIVLGLLVSENGYPIAYEIFEGNKFEGYTMLPIIDGFKEKYGLSKLIVVADSGLMSNNNVEQLKAGGYEFIIGARIKNEKKALKKKITSLNLKDGEIRTIAKDDLRLIITFSNARASKDQYNRKKGLTRLEKQVKGGKLKKENINNRGYNKFLKMTGGIRIEIDEEKIKEDEKWDGLKGYLTNSSLDERTLLDNYSQLWKIEKAFRIVKSELKIRPVFHYKKRRIEGHFCLTFAAYKVYKELERQLKEMRSEFSPEKVIDIIKSIYQIELTAEKTNKKIKRVLILTDEQKKLSQLFDFGC